jgi:hypothetical protein
MLLSPNKARSFVFLVGRFHMIVKEQELHQSSRDRNGRLKPPLAFGTASVRVWRAQLREIAPLLSSSSRPPRPWFCYPPAIPSAYSNAEEGAGPQDPVSAERPFMKAL